MAARHDIEDVIRRQNEANRPIFSPRPDGDAGIDQRIARRCSFKWGKARLAIHPFCLQARIKLFGLGLKPAQEAQSRNARRRQFGGGRHNRCARHIPHQISR